MAANSQKNQEKVTGTPVRLGEPSVIVRNVTAVYKAKISAGEAAGKGSKVGRAVHSVFRIPYTQTVCAVDRVSFTARTGEAIGLLGANGAGKSTLLRMIAGVETPTSGSVAARSKPRLLGVNAALVSQLSGLKNVELGCLAMGMKPREVKEITPEVVELAGIGDAIHRPMETYSSGMAARLRFAISAASKPDILLIDEALGTGDAAFKTRSDQILTGIREGAGTIFVVSHAAKTIEEMCTRAIWIHRGRIIADGPAYETARQYRWWAHQIANGNQEQAAQRLTEIIADYRQGLGGLERRG